MARSRVYRFRRALLAPVPSLDHIPTAPPLPPYVWHKPTTTTTPTLSRVTIIAPAWLRPVAALGALLLAFGLLTLLAGCAGPLRTGEAPADAAALPTLAPPAEMPPLATPRAVEPTPTGMLRGWWAPGEGEAVTVDPSTIVGWLATCPANPNLVLTLLVDGSKVWLFRSDAGVSDAMYAGLPPAGGVCEVR